MSVQISAGDLSKGGAVVETSAGVKYSIYATGAGGNVLVYKNIDGTPSLVGNGTSAAIFGSGALYVAYVHAAIDSNDDIHIIVSSNAEDTRDVAYSIFDTGTETFGTWEEAYNYTEQAPTTPGCSISLDSSDVAHIAIVDNVKQTGAAADNVYYANRDGGSWGNIQKIGERTTKTDVYNSPTITIRNSDYIEIVYYFETNGDVAYRSYTGSWGNESVYSETGAIIGLGGVLSTTGGTVYRYYRDYTNNIDENGVDTGYNADTNLGRVSVSLVADSDRYIFYIDLNDDVHLISNDGGGWTDEGVVQTGTYKDPIAEWAYNNENQSGELNYVFQDGSNVYYDSFSLSAGVDVTPSAVAAGADSIDPTVRLGSVSVTPSVSAGGADSIDPTVKLGDINVTPSADTASAVGVGPTAQLGDIDLTPAVVTSTASGVDPSVQQDSVNVSPALVSSGAASIDPTIQLGSISITPAVGVAGADSVDPSVLLGSANVTPIAASAGSSTDLIVIKLDVYHPSTDDLRNNWVTESDGTTNIYQSIDELLASDSDYIKSSVGPSSEIYRTKLESVTDPGQNDYHYVNYRYKKESATPQINLIVRLKQSTTVIASWSHTDIGTSEVTKRQKLSTVQAGNITDYTNLYLEFEANEV